MHTEHINVSNVVWKTKSFLQPVTVTASLYLNVRSSCIQNNFKIVFFFPCTVITLDSYISSSNFIVMLYLKTFFAIMYFSFIWSTFFYFLLSSSVFNSVFQFQWLTVLIPFLLPWLSPSPILTCPLPHGSLSSFSPITILVLWNTITVILKLSDLGMLRGLNLV